MVDESAVVATKPILKVKEKKEFEVERRKA